MGNVVVDVKETTRRYNRIDLAKLFCACLVVLIHVFEARAGHTIGNLLTDCFTNQAVPFFFIVSGYFFGKKIYMNCEKTNFVCKYIKNMLLLYIAWCVLWFPHMLHLYMGKYEDASVFYLFAVIIRRVVIAGYGVYWYLLVLVESIVVITVLVRLKQEKVLYIIAIIGLVWGLLYDASFNYGLLGNANNIIYLIFSWSNNLIMKGIPYVTFGVFFAKNTEYFEDLSSKILGVCYCLICVCCVGLYKLNINVVGICACMQAVTLFLFAIQPSKKTRVSVSFSRECRNLSSVIYMVHTIIIYLFVDLIWTIHAPLLFRYVITLGLSILIYIIVKKINRKPLNWLMSI